MLQHEGLSVRVAAFERPFHQGRMPSCPVTVLGRIENGKYLQRAWKMLRALGILRREIARSDVVYASGSDLALFGLIAGLFLKVPLVAEVGDVREVQTAPDAVGFLARRLEAAVMRSAALIVSTTKAFVEDYYHGWLKVATPALVIENKLEPGMPAPAPRPPGDRAPLRAIGYFGLLRCPRAWETLEALASARPDITVVVAGFVFEPPDLVERASKLPNVKWLGSYKSPEALPALYGQIDIIWGACPFPTTKEQNWRWALPNRFYESCQYRTPMIVLTGSGTSRLVNEYKVGLNIGFGTVADDVRLIEQITPNDLARWRDNLSKLDPKLYTYTDEATTLARSVVSIAEESRGKRRRS